MERLLKEVKEKNHNLPLQSLFWELERHDNNQNRRYIFSEYHNTEKYEAYTFYKPIIMLF